MSVAFIDGDELDKWLSDGEELAVLDLRDESVVVQHGAPLFASPLPAGKLLGIIESRVPRKNVRVVLVDAGEGVAAVAAENLGILGYSRIYVLEGGLPAWIARGHSSSFSTPPPVFTSQVRARFDTPSVRAAELQELYQRGADVVVLDTRTAEEFAKGHVPRAIHAPGGELLHRFAEWITSEDTLILASCAGNPRGVLGAQTLINAGIQNRVAVLEEGTRGWQQAGLELEVSPALPLPPVTAEALAFAGRSADVLQSIAPLRSIEQVDMDGLLAARDWRTVYLLDVRAPEEYQAGHVAGSLSAPGGQLILGTLRYVGVRGATLVLIDDTGVRATTAGYWLQQRGWDVLTLRIPTLGDAGGAVAAQKLQAPAFS
jgi:rhodanese-related sulfurtransferase